ncbi:MAG: 5-(carboxyamino)imidazole ribonucleotide mutase [Candidatus Marinimicrobia bacterium]|jgi:phosphoribosylaminoimidazole carboxylase PurE protein|nr:5-(carboxyamino)imidazole ribonucleotide mutase [Candidatus Neomarinimicrobiota bacterium]MCK9560419.1 5-(carboxyamino)imidazole ribonucleotide mutase [Candidatus Neomarinimicrobiota bacterium]MDD5062873.1 5-(carboxyamino)imidazole ribonucleotide mutase [Candidatus Neomarinimicrobiota bacterium]MDD5230554.1 5-(carboxyamino)imidazole ribonucleotide mutase [Candidatus Neomarinimicrobiota bacterium]MDD5539232.1 5-(carboxyamino)imidazole ribonucleotide mutase [Candidatus Neomarinimicrobiota bact
MEKIALIVGSKSDIEIVEQARPYLDYFGLDSEIKVLSAHRQHAALVDYVKKFEYENGRLIIACAGMAAHLPGVIAALTNLPVIGVPLNASALHGVDALYSIVQMPGGIPVGTMAIGKPGIINAVIYAARILSLSNDRLKTKLVEFAERGYKLD